MEKRKQLEIVKELTDVYDESRIVINELGWTSRVYIINDGEFVFKFLKNKKYQEELEHELNVLKLIKNHVFNVNIPLIAWVGKDNEYIGFRGISGKSMTTETISELTDEQKRNVGTQIGIFIKTLHAIKYTGKNPNSENAQIEWLLESYRKKKRILKKYFNEKEIDFIEKLVTSLPEKSAKYGIEEVFCHGDLGYNNIILSNNLEVGIIDFGDAGKLDKSYDFIGLEDNVMLGAAILAYGGDKVLMEKVAIRRLLLPLMEMLFLIDRKNGIEIAKCANKMRGNLKH
jgi:aminoglycoside phosphotransferase (APT) family kinase protein